jgi:putative permease
MRSDGANPGCAKVSTGGITFSGLIPWIGGLIIVVLLAFSIRHTLSSFILAFVIAYIFDPLLRLGERLNVPRRYGLVILYFFLGGVSAATLFFIYPTVRTLWESLLLDLPLYVQKVKTAPHPWGAESNGLPAMYADVMKNLGLAFGNLGIFLYQTASTIVFNFFSNILAPILVYFMLLYKHEIINECKGWLPSAHRYPLVQLGHDIDESIGAYIRGQIVVSCIVAVMTASTLFALGVDYPILNGAFAGLASVLPFIGVVIAAVPALFFAYAKFHTISILMKVIISFSGIYFLEGYLIKPIVFKKAMELNPLVTIIMVMTLGELFGFLGILLAVPIASSIKIFFTHLRSGRFSHGG